MKNLRNNIATSVVERSSYRFAPVAILGLAQLVTLMAMAMAVA